MEHRGSPRYFCRINSKIEKDELGQRMETSIQGTEILKVLTGDSKSVASETSGVQVAGWSAVTLCFPWPSLCPHSRAGSTSYLCFQTAREPSPPPCKPSRPSVLLEELEDGLHEVLLLSGTQTLSSFPSPQSNQLYF